MMECHSYMLTIDFSGVARDETSNSDRLREMAREARRADLNTLSQVAAQVFTAVAQQVEGLERVSLPVREAICKIQINLDCAPDPSKWLLYVSQLESLMNRCIGMALIESDVQIHVTYERVEVAN